MSQFSFYYLLFILLVIALMAGSFLFAYLASISKELTQEWKAVLNKLRLRLDKLPAVLEAIKIHTRGQEQLVQEILELRSKGWGIADLTPEKIQVEHSISEKLQKLFEIKEQFPELQRSVFFLATIKEIQSINQEIEKALDHYNKKVYGYNKLVNFIIFKPLALLFGFKSFLVFEAL